MLGNAWALGYLLALLPPLVLVGSSAVDWPWATFLIFIAASPLTRFVFGVHKGAAPHLSEGLVRLLFLLPAIYLAVLIFCLPAAAHAFLVIDDQPFSAKVGWGVSLWTTLVFGTFPAHEMLHRRQKGWIRAGAFLSGLCGYPIQGLEHSAHHARGGRASLAEGAHREESVWAFVARRTPIAVTNAWQRNMTMMASGGWRAPSPLLSGMLGTLVGIVAMAATGAQGAVLVYLCAMAGVVVSMQIMTFVQHWGLSDVIRLGQASEELAWEDDCLMQAWLTMNNSLHASHHRTETVPYFYLTPLPLAPRQPGCYVVMLSACVVPGIWRRLMYPVLDEFVQNPLVVCQPGRRAICIRPTPRS